MVLSFLSIHSRLVCPALIRAEYRKRSFPSKYKLCMLIYSHYHFCFVYTENQPRASTKLMIQILLPLPRSARARKKGEWGEKQQHQAGDLLPLPTHHVLDSRLVFSLVFIQAVNKKSKQRLQSENVTFLKCLKGLQWQPLSPNAAQAQQKAFVIFVIVILNIFMSKYGKDELRWKRSAQKLRDVAKQIQPVRLRQALCRMR